MMIDWWTLGIQTVNVVILIWLLGHFFWRPVAAMIEQRRAETQQILTEAEAKRGQAAAALAGIEQTRAGFAREREAILAAARQAAEETRTERLDEAAREAASLEAAAKVAIEKQKDAAEKAWAERASRLAVEIAKRLAARLDGSAVQAAFLEWLLEEIQALPDPVRLTVAANGVELEAICATPIEPANQARYRELIGKAFGARPEITFKVDPTLIAGLELHGPHLVVSNSWRADLSKILAELTHDKRSWRDGGRVA
ncbi:ATPase [Methylocapsa acidiphila]|uniref:F0F1 ATP synthase subunit B family protein n=1 Tax=Methylocapsa acidiphila TaxID=133552 RepID=UPI000417645B|nr:ATPase [Methylocapsa acidiphila]